MELIVQLEIPCPYCGEVMVEEFDTSQGNQQLITDCTVCCRPMEVAVECRPGELYSVTVER